MSAIVLDRLQLLLLETVEMLPIKLGLFSCIFWISCKERLKLA